MPDRALFYGSLGAWPTADRGFYSPVAKIFRAGPGRQRDRAPERVLFPPPYRGERRRHLAVVK